MEALFGELDALRLGIKLLGHAGGLGGIGALAYLLLIDRGAALARRLAVWGPLAALLLVPLGLWLEVAFLAGGWRDSLDAALWSLVLDGPGATAALVQGVGLSLVALAGGVQTLRPPAGLLGGVLALGAPGLGGHVAALEPVRLGQALLLLHLAGAAFWLGSLWPLLRATTQGAGRALTVLTRFSRIATVLVPLLLVAGAVLALMLVGSLTALVTTPYGRILLVKLTLVAGLLTLAAANKWRLVPRLQAGEASALGRLRLSIRIEIVLGMCVLVATSALTTLAGPPA